MSGPDLAAFLSRHPWPAELLAAEPLEFLWHFEIDAPLEVMWPLLTDTSRFNRALGLPEMHFEERDGILHGWAVNGGFRQVWKEVPWQWVHARHLLAIRDYEQGFARWVRAIYEVVPPKNGKTDRFELLVYFGWIPRGWFYRKILGYGFGQVEAQYRRVLADLAASTRRSQPSPLYRVPLAALDETGEAHLQAKTRALLETGMQPELVERLAKHLRTADELELARIQPKVLARQWNIDPRELLRVTLHATRVGLLDLSWDIVCPHCRGTREELASLSRIPGESRCDPCEAQFDTRSETSVEVTFRVHASIRKIVQRQWCAAEPAKRDHIYVQLELAPGERRSVSPLLTAGLYRMRHLGDPSPRLLEVRAGASREPIVWTTQAADNELRGLSPTFELHNDGASTTSFVLERAQWSDEAVRPGDLLSLREFRDIFSEDFLAHDVQLAVGMQTVLFTDMVGSTRFYTTRGDAEAFIQVRQHFAEMFDVIAAHEGVVVKDDRRRGDGRVRRRGLGDSGIACDPAIVSRRPKGPRHSRSNLAQPRLLHSSALQRRHRLLRQFGQPRGQAARQRRRGADRDLHQRLRGARSEGGAGRARRRARDSIGGSAGARWCHRGAALDGRVIVDPRDITARTLLRIGGHDLLLAIAAPIVFAGVLGAADWRVLAVLMALRIGAWAAHARSLLEPVRAWQALDPAEVSDQQLLDVDAALDRFSPQFLRAYISGWVVSIGLAVLLGAFKFPVPLNAGAAEQLIATLMLPVLTIGEICSNKPLIKGALLEVRTRVAALLLERGMQPDKPPSSLTNDMLLTFLGLTLGISTLVIAVGGLIHARDVRERSAIEQLARAELAALQLHHGDHVAVESGLAILSTDELPVELTLDDGGESASRRAILPAQHSVLAAAPVGDGRWVLARAQPDEQLRFLLAFWLGFMVVVGIPLAVVARALTRSLTDPLTILDESTRKVIDEGRIRSLGRIVSLQDDEVGRLAASFNRLLDRLGELATVASAVADGNLKVELEHSGELHDAFRGMLSRLREVVGQIQATALELAATTAEILAATREQEVGADRQSADMQQVSATVDSLAASAAEIAHSVEIVLDNAARASTTTNAMTDRISEFDVQTRGIAELLELIREIADRSDLLALNGSLEAVRAGEAGRGFALVAAEMRRLAERVHDAVASVRERVEDIDRATALTVESTKRSQDLVQSTAAAARSISEMTKRQSLETQYASSVVRNAAASVLAGAAATSQTRASAEALRQQADELAQLVRRFDN